MELQIASLNGAPLLELEGDIDHNNCGTVESALQEALADNGPVILFDLSRVTYLDNGGICVLLAGCRRVRDTGWLGVINPNQNVHRLLEIVGLLVDPGFRVFVDRRAAAAAVEEVLPQGQTT